MTLDLTDSKDFLSVSELARQWHVTEQHIHNLISRLELPAYRIGRRVIVRRDDAQDFLQRNATFARAA
jgi:excisionase family DNA binding protein